jgi:Plasmid pRiA4b ORF-3-like protein
MATRRTWWSITVELVEGRGRHVWPRPGRTIAAAPHHTFKQFATAIDDAFARWDRAHLHEFHFPKPDDPTGGYERVGRPDRDWDDPPISDMGTEKLRRLRPGEQFVYVFDLGDDWTHLCTVNPDKIDPLETLGITTSEMPGPLPFFGWGDIPDQYGRRWLGDVSDEDPVPPDPDLADLPPLRPWWGPRSQWDPGLSR